MELVKKNGEAINCWQDWEPPKKDYQWKEGRSAMEVAKSWFRQSVAAPPKESEYLLEGSLPGKVLEGKTDKRD